MKSNWSIYILLFLLLFFPILDISGHFINPVEFYIYALFLMNLKKMKPLACAKIIIVYMGLFSVTVVFTALLAGKALNNYDFYVLRNCAQLVCLMIFLYGKTKDIAANASHDEFKSFMLKCFTILSLPVLVIYFQRFNLFYSRELVQFLYKPQFFFLDATVFSEFRYTSVFKDFFTAGIYFTTLATGLYYFYLIATPTKKEKIIILTLLALIYISQVFVARTSLVVIPFNMILLTLFASQKNILKSLLQLVGLLMIIIPLFSVGIYFLIEANLIKSEWVSEGWAIVSFMTDSDVALPNQGSSSFQVMQNWNANFFKYLADHPEMLLTPNHDYDLKETAFANNLYTDSFYPQEIYRYGIYGILAYLYLVILLLKNFIKKYNGLVVIVLSFVLLNYKGGNVFFMPKNVYLYAFIFTAFIVFEGLLNPKKDSL